MTKIEIDTIEQFTGLKPDIGKKVRKCTGVLGYLFLTNTLDVFEFVDKEMIKNMFSLSKQEI